MDGGDVAAGGKRCRAREGRIARSLEDRRRLRRPDPDVQELARGLSQDGPSALSPAPVITAVLALIFGVLGAYGFRHFVEGPPQPPGPTAGGAARGPEDAGLSTRDLGDQVSKLADRVERVQKRLDDQPRPEPPPDLSDL